MDSQILKFADSLGQVLELTSRIDERVKHIIDRQDEADLRIESLIQQQNGILARIAALESAGVSGLRNELSEAHRRLAHLESQSQPHGKTVELCRQDINELKNIQHEMNLRMAGLTQAQTVGESRWKMIIDAIFKIAVLVGGGILLHKLGLPQVP